MKARFEHYKGVYYLGHFRTHKSGSFWIVFDDSKEFDKRRILYCDRLSDAKKVMLERQRASE